MYDVVSDVELAVAVEVGDSDGGQGPPPGVVPGIAEAARPIPEQTVTPRELDWFVVTRSASRSPSTSAAIIERRRNR